MTTATAGAPTGRRAGFDLEGIKTVLPIEGVLSAHGIVLRRGRGPCAICGTSSSSTSFSARGRRFSCFACGKSGSVIDLVAELDGLSLRDAIQRCAELAGVGPATARPLRCAIRPADAREAAAARQCRIWRETASLRDVSQQIADDAGQPMEVRIAAIRAVHDCNATLDLMLESKALRSAAIDHMAPRVPS